MNFNVLRRSIADKRLSILVYAVGVAAYAVMILAIWPSLRENVSTLNQMWESYPEGIRKAFGGENFTFATFDGFLSVEYFNQMWVIVMTAFSVSIATGAISSEIEKGTMELLLAQPVSRRSLLLTRHLFFELGLLFLIGATLIPIAIGAPVAGGDIDYMGLLAMVVPSFLFFTAIGSFTFFFSVLFNTRGTAIFVSLGIIIISYALDILAKINDTISNVHFLSIFYYWDPYRYLHNLDFAWVDLIILTIIALISTTAAVYRFERRDIAV
ncbi:MAG: ABC transporter permease subunit [Thermoleophilia bacterium]